MNEHDSRNQLLACGFFVFNSLSRGYHFGRSHMRLAFASFLSCKPVSIPKTYHQISNQAFDPGTAHLEENLRQTELRGRSRRDD
jgi:hypothetical protein